MTPRELASHIERLNARELAELNRLLGDMPGWGGASVREPRRPLPNSDSTSATSTLAERQQQVRYGE